MRWMATLAVVLGCGGVPAVPATLEEVADVPETGQDLPAAFDVDDTLVLMDPSTGLRRLVGSRLRSIPNGDRFTFGAMSLDRDGALLVGSSNFTVLGRIEGDLVVTIDPPVPTSFTAVAATPSGAYHVMPFNASTTLMLPAGGTTWVDSMRALDRTLRAPDGTIYAILDGDVVTLEADDSASIVASCAEIAGGFCSGLELVGVDGAGHVHLAIAGRPEVFILDPAVGFRTVSLPGNLELERMATGPLHAFAIATDPDRNDERSLWMLPDGGAELQRVASIAAPVGFNFVRVLVDHAGTGHLIAQGKLQRVVIE